MKIVIIATAAAMIAGVASAETLQLQMETSNGAKVLYVLDDGKIETPEGMVFDYRFSDDRKEMCTIVPDFGDICTSFDAPIEKPGDTASYETPDLGRSGIARVLENK